MKKIVIVMLFIPTLSFLYPDSGCRVYKYRWGRRSLETIDCYCNCSQYGKANNKCMQCRHIHIPKNITINSNNS